MREDGDTRAWIRLVDGRFVLTWQTRVAPGSDDWQPGGTRPLTLKERIAWQAAKRVPKPVRGSQIPVYGSIHKP